MCERRCANPRETTATRRWRKRSMNQSSSYGKYRRGGNKKDGDISFFWGQSGETESGVQDLGSPRVSGQKCEIVRDNVEKGIWVGVWRRRCTRNPRYLRGTFHPLCGFFVNNGKGASIRAIPPHAAVSGPC